MVLPLLSVRDLRKHYTAAIPALDGVSLDVPAGAIVALLGPSGCGKTTLLRIIAGLEHADSGSVIFDDAPIDSLPTYRRGFGLMFQDYALFPHMSVAENIAFGLHTQHLDSATIRTRVTALLELVGLSAYAERRVDALSGGERQRVALARSLAPEPRLLMLDEPLGALDRALRERLLDELRTILRTVGVTSLYVTHDQLEAFAIADWLVLMNQGQIEQQGQPETLYQRPATAFVARFLGLRNLLPGTVRDVLPNGVLLETALGKLQVAAGDVASGVSVLAVLRPEAAELVESSSINRSNLIHGTLVERTFLGGRIRIRVQTAIEQPLEFELDAAGVPDVGSEMTLAIRPEATSTIIA